MSAVAAESAVSRPVLQPRRRFLRATHSVPVLKRTATVALRLVQLGRPNVERTNAVLAMSDPEEIRRALSPDRRLEETRWRLVSQGPGTISR
jgi:hypothetical protein